jgi:hypothetical protein
MGDLMYTIVQSTELNELRRLATKYEENKRYIELGKAVKEAFENGYALDAWEYDEMDELKIFDSIKNDGDLLEWAEGRE